MSANPLIAAAEAKVAQKQKKQGAVENYTQGSGDFFGQKWNMALALATSSFIPEVFKNKAADVMIAMELAEQMRLSFFTVIQNLDIIKGKTGWKATFVIALINSSNRFNSNIQFQWDNNEQKSLENPNWGCTAYVEQVNGERLYGSRVSIDMAIKEGWTKKKNVEHSKWETMPEQMLMYRAASFFSRVHCPDLTMGLQTIDEILAVEPASEETVQKAKEVLPPANITVDAAVELKTKEITKTKEDQKETTVQKAKEVLPPVNETVEEIEQEIEQDVEVTTMKDLIGTLGLLGFKIMQTKTNTKGQNWAQIVAADDEADFEQVQTIIGIKRNNPTDNFFVMNVTNLK